MRIESHACVGGAYGLVECIEKIQKEYPEELQDLKAIEGVKMELLKLLIGHYGWTATRPIAATGAQMNIIHEVLDR